VRRGRAEGQVETFNAERERGEAHRMQVTRSELAKLHADIATLKPQREEEEAAVAATLAAEVGRLQARLDAERAVRVGGRVYRIGK
jgi:predicted transcriptional regulator